MAFQQNLREKIHAFCRQREEDFDPGNHEIFRFRLRLSVFRGQTFVEGPLVHLSLNKLSSVWLSPKSGEGHTHFVRSTVSHMFFAQSNYPQLTFFPSENKSFAYIKALNCILREPRRGIKIVPQNSTLQEINISHLGKRKIIFKMPFLGDMLVSWRVSIYDMFL